MSPMARALIAAALMTVALVVTIIDGVTNGWTTLGIVALVCFAAAIVAQVVAIVRMRGGRFSGQ